MRQEIKRDLSQYKNCEKCNEPMIGILKQSGSQAPRKVCSPCGGKAIEAK